MAIENGTTLGTKKSQASSCRWNQEDLYASPIYETGIDLLSVSLWASDSKGTKPNRSSSSDMLTDARTDRKSIAGMGSSPNDVSENREESRYTVCSHISEFT